MAARGECQVPLLEACARPQREGRQHFEATRKTTNNGNETGKYMAPTIIISNLVRGFKDFLFSPRKLGKISNLINTFQMGWNHQLVTVNFRNPYTSCFLCSRCWLAIHPAISLPSGVVEDSYTNGYSNTNPSQKMGVAPVHGGNNHGPSSAVHQSASASLFSNMVRGNVFAPTPKCCCGAFINDPKKKIQPGKKWVDVFDIQEVFCWKVAVSNPWGRLLGMKITSHPPTSQLAV